MQPKGEILSNLSKTASFFSRYVYDSSNRSNMLTAHALDVANIGIIAVAPLLALSYFENDEDVIAGFLLMIPTIAPRILNRLKERALAPVTIHVQSQFTAELHKQTFHQPYNPNVSAASGAFAQAIACNYGSVSAFVVKFYGEFSPFVAESAIISTLLIAKYETTALIVPASLFIYAVGMAKFLQKYDEIRKESIGTMRENYGGVLSSISRHKMAKQFNRIELEKILVRPSIETSEVTFQHGEVVRSYANAWGTFIGYSQLLACVIYTLKLHQDNELDIYEVFVFNFFSYTIAMLIDNMSNSIIDISKACVDAQTIIKFTTNTSDEESPISPDDLVLEKAPSIDFRGIHFAYPQQMSNQPVKEVLKELSFHVPAGKTIAFVGKSGVGKSTITQLLQRLYLPQAGNISINGQNISSVSMTSLYHGMAVVEQSTEFLRDNWYENIAYAREDATEEQVVEAANLAGLIKTTEGAMELRERSAGISGHSLSGGEKQRIAVARAILKGGVILILDEATSALDPETELQVQDTLNKLRVGVTTLMITHKLYLLSNVDHVYYLKDGLIIEHGTCSELIQRRGSFYQQLQIQLIEQGNGCTPEVWLQNLMQNMTQQMDGAPLLHKNWSPYRTMFYHPPLVSDVMRNTVSGPFTDESMGSTTNHSALLLASTRK